MVPECCVTLTFPFVNGLDVIQVHSRSDHVRRRASTRLILIISPRIMGMSHIACAMPEEGSMLVMRIEWVPKSRDL